MITGGETREGERMGKIREASKPRGDTTALEVWFLDGDARSQRKKKTLGDGTALRIPMILGMLKAR